MLEWIFCVFKLCLVKTITFVVLSTLVVVFSVVRLALVMLSSNPRKVILLGFLPDKMKNIYYYDKESNCTKIASHFLFDEGFNDLSLDKQPPKVIFLCNTRGGKPFPIDPPSYSTSNNFDLFDIPFTQTNTYIINVKCEDSTFGILVGGDEVNHCAFVLDTSKSKKFRVAIHFKSIADDWKISCGRYIVAINDSP